MRPSVVFCGEGVLWRPNESFGASEPIQEGLGLYKTLVTQFPCYVICDTEKKMLAETWLKLNGLKDAMARIHESPDGLDSAGFEWQQICRIRAQGPIWFVISSRTDIIDRCSNGGIFSLEFHRPGAFSAPPQRKPWSERSTEVKAELLARVSAGEQEEPEY